MEIKRTGQIALTSKTKKNEKSQDKQLVNDHSFNQKDTFHVKSSSAKSISFEKPHLKSNKNVKTVIADIIKSDNNDKPGNDLHSPPVTITCIEEIKSIPSSPIFNVYPGGAPGEESRKISKDLLLAGNLRIDVKSTIIRDLSSLPLNILRLLKNDELNVVVVKEGESIADTPLLSKVKPEEYQRLAGKGRAIFDDLSRIESENTKNEIDKSLREGKDDPFHIEMIRYWESDCLKKSIEERLIKENIGFTVLSAKEPENLRQLAEKFGVNNEDDFCEWEKTFLMINDGHIKNENGMVCGNQGVLLMPYTYYKGKPVSLTTLKNYKIYDSKYIKDSLGIHLWEDKLIILHEDYAGDPAKEVGHYRIILHEAGHAIDHAIERLPEIGDKHNKKVNELYRKDLQELKSGGQNRFVSPRAIDNVREYFAEAIESYMTVEIEDQHDYYKSGNNHDDLKKINPELFSYIDNIMTRNFQIPSVK